jgi:hypothetical protein
MHVAATVILRLSVELEADGRSWSHPWDHYPFVRDNKCVWLAWHDLDQQHREQVRRALVQIERSMGTLATSRELA